MESEYELKDYYRFTETLVHFPRRSIEMKSIAELPGAGGRNMKLRKKK